MQLIGFFRAARRVTLIVTSSSRGLGHWGRWRPASLLNQVVVGLGWAAVVAPRSWAHRSRGPAARPDLRTW